MYKKYLVLPHSARVASLLLGGLMLCLLFPFTVSAQQNLGLHFLRDAWQSTNSNPAFITERTSIFALPQVAFEGSHSGFTFEDILQDGLAGEPKQLDYASALLAMEDENHIKFRTNISLFAFAVRVKKLQFSFSAESQADLRMLYPRSLAELAWKGNAELLDRTLNIAPQLQVNGYHTFALGGAYQINEKLSVGARLKYLNGFASVSTQNHKASIYTDSEFYQTRLESDYIINFSMLSLGNPEDVEFDFDFQPFTSNRGWATDLGVVYQASEKLNIAASLINLGASIRWNESVSNWSSEGSYLFEGSDARTLLTDGSSDLDSIAEQISDTFEFQESQNEYTTRLPGAFWLSAMYQFAPKTYVGAAFRSTWFQGDTEATTVLSVRRQVGKFLDATLHYSARSRYGSDLGLALQLRGGPFQFLVASDQILSLLTPRRAQQFGARWGITFGF